MAYHRWAPLPYFNGQGYVMPTTFYIIPRIGGIAYLNMPKSACTSILHYLSKMRLNGNFIPPSSPLDDGSDPIHGFAPPYAHLDYFFGRWTTDSPPIPSSFIKFSFVRNPYARFYSFYKSKILLGQTPGNHYKRIGIEKGCSFADCIRKITTVAPEELEHHAAPQSMIALDKDTLLADFVGKVENFSEDWSVIQRLTGYELDLKKYNVTKSSRQPVYTKELKERIYEYYRDDFELFDYNRDSVALLDGNSTDIKDDVYTAHRLSATKASELKERLSASGKITRLLAEEFHENPDKRKEYFATRDEQFRELLQKSIFSVATSVSTLEEKTSLLIHNNAAQQQLGEMREIETRNREHAALNERISHLATALADEKQKVSCLQKTLHKQLLAAYSLNRNSYWKRIKRFSRFSGFNESRLLRNSGHVDPHYYFTQYPGLIAGGLSAASHYLLYGAQEGKNPSSTFNTVGYLAEHPHLAYIGVNPLVHFILSGETGASS